MLPDGVLLEIFDLCAACAGEGQAGLGSNKSDTGLAVTGARLLSTMVKRCFWTTTSPLDVA